MFYKSLYRFIISILQALGIDPDQHGPKTENIINEATFVIEGHDVLGNVDRERGEALEDVIDPHQEFQNGPRDQENMDIGEGEALEDVVEKQEELEDVDREGREHLEDAAEHKEQFEAVQREQEFENENKVEDGPGREDRCDLFENNEDILDMFDKVNNSDTPSSKPADNLGDDPILQSDSELCDLNNSATLSNSEQFSGSEKEDDPRPSKRNKHDSNDIEEQARSTTPPHSMTGGSNMTHKSSRHLSL